MQPGEFLLRRRPLLRSGHHIFQPVLNDGYRLLDGAHGAGLELVDATDAGGGQQGGGDSHLPDGLIRVALDVLSQLLILLDQILLFFVYPCDEHAATHAAAHQHALFVRQGVDLFLILDKLLGVLFHLGTIGRSLRLCHLGGHEKLRVIDKQILGITHRGNGYAQLSEGVPVVIDKALFGLHVIAESEVRLTQAVDGRDRFGGAVSHGFGHLFLRPASLFRLLDEVSKDSYQRRDTCDDPPHAGERGNSSTHGSERGSQRPVGSRTRSCRSRLRGVSRRIGRFCRHILCRSGSLSLMGSRVCSRCHGLGLPYGGRLFGDLRPPLFEFIQRDKLEGAVFVECLCHLLRADGNSHSRLHFGHNALQLVVLAREERHRTRGCRQRSAQTGHACDEPLKARLVIREDAALLRHVALNVLQAPQLIGQRTVSRRLLIDAAIYKCAHLFLQFADTRAQRIVRGGVLFHLLLVLLQLGLRLCELLGLFAQLFDKRLMGFDLLPDGHLTLREPAAPLEALGGKDVGASNGLVFLFELPNMIQVLIDRIVNLIEPLLDLGGHL